MWFPALWFLLAGLIVAAALVPLARRVSDHVGMVAHPTPDRWHQRSVGKLGGVAMAAALAIVWPASGVWAGFWPLILTTGLMCGIGLWDDLRPVRPATKLVGQVMVVALLLYLVPPIGITGNLVLDQGIAFFWVLGLTNAFNLLDNIDGLSAGIAAIAASFLTLALLTAGVDGVTPLAFALAAFVGVTFGFLIFNFQPASIFMGDSGSHLIGFFVSASVLQAVPHLPTSALVPAVAGPVVTLLIPIFDTAFVTVTRGLAGRSIFSGGRDHTSHRLVALGISERRAVLVLYALAILGGLVGASVHLDQSRYTWGLVVLYATALTGLGLFLGHSDATHPDVEVTGSRLLPTELTNRYRVYEVSLDALLIGVAYYLAFGIRFEGDEFRHFLPYFAQSLPLVLGLQIAGLAIAGKYRQVWRSFGAAEAASLLKGISIGVTATVLSVLYLYRFQGFSRAVFLIDAALLTALLLGTRAALATFDDYLRRQRAHGRHALIIGAGRGGALAVRELLQNPALGLVPCGFLDDDESKLKRRIDGYRVMGRLSDLPVRLDEMPGQIATVIIAIRDLPTPDLEAIWQACDARKIPVQRMRFSLEDTDWRDRSASVVKFPER
jgi:UDP-GlcNAc:undecaprenyl-phosphate GlcNAc-1-phosphate transferase